MQWMQAACGAWVQLRLGSRGGERRRSDAQAACDHPTGYASIEGHQHGVSAAVRAGWQRQVRGSAAAAQNARSVCVLRVRVRACAARRTLSDSQLRPERTDASSVCTWRSRPATVAAGPRCARLAALSRVGAALGEAGGGASPIAPLSVAPAGAAAAARRPWASTVMSPSRYGPVGARHAGWRVELGEGAQAPRWGQGHFVKPLAASAGYIAM